MAGPQNLVDQLLFELQQPRNEPPLKRDPTRSQASDGDRLLTTLIQEASGLQVHTQAPVPEGAWGPLLQAIQADEGVPSTDIGPKNKPKTGKEGAATRHEIVDQSRPTSDSVLQSLLAEAKEVHKQGDPDKAAAFASKIQRLQHSEGSTPEERVAAFQLRQPDMKVEMQEDGILSFSDKGRLDIKDNETRQAVDAFRSKLDTISPDQPLVVGEGNRIEALGATTRQRTANEQVATRNALFGPTQSRSGQRIQAQLDNLLQIEDPNERYIAMQRLAPTLAQYGNQRRSEIRNEVFDQYGLARLEQDLARSEAEDRADPRWQEFRSDSPVTARLRSQVRTAKADALSEVDNRLQSDPMLTTLESKAKMTDAIIGRMDQRDSKISISEMWSYQDPAAKERMRTAMRALQPELADTDPSDTEKGKAFKINEEFYAKVASMDDPVAMMSAMVLDLSNAEKWKAVIKQGELDAGADEARATQMTKLYTDAANKASAVFTGGLDEVTVNKMGGAIRALKEQYDLEKGTLNKSDLAQRVQTYYIPRAIEAQFDVMQTQYQNNADRTIKDLGPETSHEGLNQMLVEAKERGLALGDLLDPAKLKNLPAAQATRQFENAADGPGSLAFNRPARLGILADKTAREELARYISSKRKELMLKSALVEPKNTYQDVLRKLNAAAVVGRSVQ